MHTTLTKMRRVDSGDLKKPSVELAATPINRHLPWHYFERTNRSGWTQYLIVRWSTSDALVKQIGHRKLQPTLRWAAACGLPEMEWITVHPLKGIYRWRLNCWEKMDPLARDSTLWLWRENLMRSSVARSGTNTGNIHPDLIAQEVDLVIFRFQSDAKSDFPAWLRSFWMWFSRLLRNSRKMVAAGIQDRTGKWSSNQLLTKKAYWSKPLFQSCLWRAPKLRPSGTYISRPDVLN